MPDDARLVRKTHDVVLTVHIPAWHLEEDGDVITVGDHLSTWLEFHENTRWDQPPDQQHRLTGLARALPAWLGAESGRHPTIIGTDEATIYWDAPEPTSGPVEVTGVVSANNVDAPDGFPTTAGVVTRVRMEWQHYQSGDNNDWYPVPGTARYEDLTSSYLPIEPAGHADTTRVVWTRVLVDLEVTSSEPS
jgi:hypothetical protein